MFVTESHLTSALTEELGEPVTTAVYARVGTALSLSRWLGPLGNYLIARPAARASAEDTTERTGVPLDAAVVIALATGPDGSALHVWSADPMLSRVTDHLGSVPLSRVSTLSTTVCKGAWWPLRLELDGGDVVEVEARGDVTGLVTAVMGLKAA